MSECANCSLLKEQNMKLKEALKVLSYYADNFEGGCGPRHDLLEAAKAKARAALEEGGL